MGITANKKTSHTLPLGPPLFSISHFFTFVKRKIGILYNFCFFYKNQMHISYNLPY